MERNIRVCLQITWNVPGVATITVSGFALLARKKKKKGISVISMFKLPLFLQWIRIIGTNLCPQWHPSPGEHRTSPPADTPAQSSPADTETCSWGQLSIDGNLLLGTGLRWSQLFLQNKNKTHPYARIYERWKEVFYPGITQDDFNRASGLILVQRGCFTSN